MPSLDTLPTEIIKIIIEQFSRCRDVFACMRLCRRLFLIARQFLFHNAQPLHRILYWAIQANQMETMKAVLEAGAVATTPMMVHHRKIALRKTEPPAVFYAQWPRRLLSPHGPPPYTSRYSALHLAVREGQLDLLKVLLQRDHPIDAGSSHFCCVPWRSDYRPRLPWHDWFQYHLTPLHAALCFGQSEIAQFLIKSGASISGGEFAYQAPLVPGGPVRTGATALHLACGCGDLSTAKFLIEEKYMKDIDAQDMRARDVHATRLLILHGADLDLELDDGTPPVWLACTLRLKRKKLAKVSTHHRLRGATPEIVRLLLEGGARIDKPRIVGQNLLQRVCLAYPSPEKAAIVRHLVRYTKNFDSDVEFVRDLVYSCLVTGDGWSLKAMLERIVSPRLWTTKADILHLFKAITGRPNLACLEYLLSIDTENYILWEPTTILNLLGYGSPTVKVCGDMALLLLQSGAHQDFKRYPSTIMLHLAASHRFTDVVRWLLDRGVDIGYRDAANNSALAYAEVDDTIDLLLERGADPWDAFEHSEKNLQDTPVGMSITSNNSWKLEKLLSGCADPPPCAVYDMIECAIIIGAADCIKTLQELYPEQAEYLLTKNSGIYLLKMLVRFSRQSDPPQFDEAFRGNLADSVVDTMSLLLEHSNQPIDLEAKMQARIPMVEASIVEVIQDILAEDRVQNPDARLKNFRDFRKRVSVYWTVAEPEIIISTSSRSVTTVSSSASSVVDDGGGGGGGAGAAAVAAVNNNNNNGNNANSGGPRPIIISHALFRAIRAAHPTHHVPPPPPGSYYPPGPPSSSADSDYDTTTSSDDGADLQSDTDASADSDASSTAGSEDLIDE
ncbi:hypothetical protein MGN70_010849 [Eutypa lata]|nr:hypothetical protein MGN70_010849 [Eutypa lata]